MRTVLRNHGMGLFSMLFGAGIVLRFDRNDAGSVHRLDGVAHQVQDHLLDLVMVELGGMVPTDRGYDGKVRVLVQVFRQHARDAEALLVPELRRRLSPAERELLGRRVLERVGQLEGRPRPGW